MFLFLKSLCEVTVSCLSLYKLGAEKKVGNAA
jgi:hypothetical protein